MQSPMTCLLYEYESNADTKVTILCFNSIPRLPQMPVPVDYYLIFWRWLYIMYEHWHDLSSALKNNQQGIVS